MMSKLVKYQFRPFCKIIDILSNDISRIACESQIDKHIIVLIAKI